VQSFEGHGLLQVVVYAAAAGKLLGVPALGGVYRSMRSLKTRGFFDPDAVDLGGRGSGRDSMGREAIDALFLRTQDRVAGLAASIREGRIPADPRDKSVCEHCLVRRLCDRGGGR
jgi:hypothetical protein